MFTSRLWGVGVVGSNFCAFSNEMIYINPKVHGSSISSHIPPMSNVHKAYGELSQDPLSSVADHPSIAGDFDVRETGILLLGCLINELN